MSDYGHFCLRSIEQEKHCKLTLLLLDCWQREYDKRPYRHFQFDRLMFEQRLGRKYNPQEDFSTIVLFLAKRSLCSMKLVGLNVTTHDISLIDEFVRSLQQLSSIELLLMELPTEFFKLLASRAKEMQVREFSLRGTHLNDEDINQLHCFIIKCRTLCKLNVSSCSINQYNFAHLADAIYKSTTLISCNLSHLLGWHLTLDSNKIVHTMASLIWQNKLQELVLENCGFLGQDMPIIGEYLNRKCCQLQTLNVSFNKIGANGCCELLANISHCGTLKHLQMNGCHLATQGGEVVSQYLSSCWNLQSLEIQRNNIEAAAINGILLGMKKSCKLQKLYLFGNVFNVRSGAILRRLLAAGVVSQENLDVTVTFDDAIGGHRVIPCIT